MQYVTISHRYADIIINADYSLRKEIETVVETIKTEDIKQRYETDNILLTTRGKKERKGMQASLNNIFREKFKELNWELEKNVFDDNTNDLVIDFWKRGVGVDVAFNHRSFIGGDLLRLQAAGEVKNVINVGVYICPVKSFSRVVSPSDASSMVSFERVKWFLESFYSVLTVPIWLIGLQG